MSGLRTVILAGKVLMVLCACTPSDGPGTSPSTAAPKPIDASIHRDLDRQYERIRDFIGDDMYGPGGRVVLMVAYRALRDKHESGEGLLVGLEDLWAHALQEGLALFNQPDLLWGRTTAEETSDMIGQTTIGPWQMTVANIRNVYGPRYGIDPRWSDARVYGFCRDHPDLQAKMIIDYIQVSYETLGRRSPYAIQRYFWLEPFVKGEIGRSEDWTRSVVAKPPKGGTWKDLTPEMKADTGFYAKQVLLGTPYTDSGLIFWLWVTEDTEAVRDVLRTWRDEWRLAIMDEQNDSEAITLENTKYVRTAESGGFAIEEDDVIYYTRHPEIRKAIRDIVSEVLLEKRQ